MVSLKPKRVSLTVNIIIPMLWKKVSLKTDLIHLKIIVVLTLFTEQLEVELNIDDLIRGRWPLFLLS